MRKLIYIVAVFLLLTEISYSQQYRWYPLPNAPQTNSRFEDVFFIDANTGWVIRSTGFPISLFRTTDGGYSWDTVNVSPIVYSRSIGFANSNTGWIGSYIGDSTLYKTTNGGLNWSLQLSSQSGDSFAICGLSVVDESNVRGCGAWYGNPKFYKTDNGGISWTYYDMSAYATRLIDCYFTSPDSGFIVGGLGSFEDGKGVVLFTSDAGQSWQNRMTTQNTGQWGWKISFPTIDTGYVSLEKGGGNGLSYYLKTTNGGVNWQENLFTNFPADEEGIGFINGNTGWLGGWWFYTYRTTNGGYTWQQDPWGYNFNRFRKINDTLAYAVGQTVYKYMRDSTVGISQISSELPDRPELSQNYPNPFNPITTIRFQVMDYEHSKLTVFDVLGREVAVLVNEILYPGEYEYKFDATGLNSGVYYYRIETFRYTETKKMILLK